MNRAPIVGLILAAVTVTAPRSPIAAQLRLETGGGASRLDQMPSTALTAFGGALHATLGRAQLDFSGTSEQHTGLGVAGALAAGARIPFSAGGFRFDVGPAAQAARGIGEQWAATLAARGTVTRTFGMLTAQAGWQEGIARIGSQAATWRQPSVGADLRIGQFLIGPTWQSTIVQDSVLRANFLFGGAGPASDTLSVYQSRVRDVQDVAVKLGWTTGLITVDARVGRRFGASIVPESWWESRASLRITPIVSLTMRTGHLASDIMLGLRGGQFTTVGLRLDLLQHGSVDPPARHGARTQELVEVVRETARTVHLYFVLPRGVRSAALEGDLTDWHPLNLARASDGRWEIVLNARSGVYRVNISADDGPWTAPPGLPANDDGFGSKVGLLILER